ncbi:YkgJ family cysteine cluster protein [Desulfospira joergensenii]|uniref:YkgJ family cysteine cluster protein n=1 Tax=Desulfospira joergensenii TaxID=53329 RepID=UPI0003B6A4DF|nr:YkgJ family cysteine cluster protein [Desulfospira joergensenii]
MKNNETHRDLLGSGTFQFACNETVPCFTRCCRDADMLLYPYDIIRLKHFLGMTSEEFLVKHTFTAFRDNPYFPSVMLKMGDAKGHPCPFLSEKGCGVYEDRPYSCRAYPLEPAMHGDPQGGFAITAYRVRHGHCLGHDHGKKWTSGQWMKDQGMEVYNQYNSSWARVAALLSLKNSFGEKGGDNPAMNMAYMASYNVDTFRRFVFESSFLQRFDVSPDRADEVKNDDSALMLLGFDWILRFLGGQGPLREKKSG